MKRYKNGRYKSNRNAEIERKAKLYTTTMILSFFTLLGFFVQPWTATYQSIRTETVYAQVEETIEEIEPASTEPVEPSSEVTQAIEALNNALGRDVTDETKKRVQYLYDKSTEKDVPFFDAVKTIYCESSWIAQKSHLPEESFGLSQIHLPSHPNITQEQAMDAYFAIDFMVKHWYTPQAVKGSMWYAYSRTSGKCVNGVKIEL